MRTQQSRHTRLAMAIATGTLLASTSVQTAADIDQIRALSPSWDAGLTVAVEGGKKQLKLGEEVRYHLSASEGGNCYLLHVDPTGATSLMEPSTCASADSGSYFPPRGKLKASSPEGKETLVAVISQKPLASLDALLQGTGGFKELDKRSFERVMNDLQSGASASSIDLAETSYWVGAEQLAMNDTDLQYTTRGIIRKVMETKKEETTVKEVSFPVQKINFEFGSDELAADGERQLNEFGAAMVSKELSGMKLRVAGHTDDLGDPVYNLDLSNRRAKTVANYLAEKFSIDSDRLDIVGMGENAPIINATTRTARAQNRRVEMVFLVE
ncbi:MAG: OmpA family protein [Halioglobus sp.]